MKEQKFIKGIWNRNEVFLCHLFDEMIRIFATVITLWLVIFIVHLFFTEELPIIKWMEVAAHFGILLIFIIDIVFDILSNIQKRKQKLDRGDLND